MFIADVMWKNRQQRSEREKEYVSAIQNTLQNRNFIWNRLFMHLLHEDVGETISDSDCERELAFAYYSSCAYVYPMHSSVLLIVESLCRCRKHKGRFDLSPRLFCGLLPNSTIARFLENIVF